MNGMLTNVSVPRARGKRKGVRPRVSGPSAPARPALGPATQAHSPQRQGREPREHDASYARAVFCGTVDPRLFDWFFNARTGYRGAYYEAPAAGTLANRALVDQLSDLLVDWALAQQLDCDRPWILASLTKPSAKAWLAECPGLCASCSGEWSPSDVSELQIENSRWEAASHTHSTWGRQAPYLTKIRIFGGLIDSEQSEWLAAHKTDRAAHIWEHGWS